MEGVYNGPGYQPSTPTDWGFDKSWERVVILAGGKKSTFALLTYVYIYTTVLIKRLDL